MRTLNLTIPKAHRSAFGTFIRYPEAKAEALFGGLSRVAPTYRMRDLAKSVAQESKLDLQEVRGILAALSGLYLLRTDWTDDQIVDAMRTALTTSTEPDLRLDGDALESFCARLRRALTFDASLGVTSKVLDLMGEHERRFCGARVITDMRPVFSSVVEGGAPAAAVICHTLRIRYHQGGRAPAEECFFAMDASNLDTLIGVLERARAKEKAMRSMVSGQGLVLLEDA